MAFDYKNATKEQLKLEYDRIARISEDDQFFTKKELAHLPEILGEGEQVLAFSSGFMDGHTWLITLTDRRIVFLDKGMFFGLTQSSINLDKVNEVGGKTGVFLGTITIEDGATTREISNVSKKSVVKFTNMVRDALENRRSPSAARDQVNAPTDVVSMLERLAALKTKGILSDAEFEQQKARILAG